MASRSPLEYDVSAAADKARRQRPRRVSGAFEAVERHCEWPGCRDRAAYRAPHSPERLNDYRWFCLDHVRQYNASWNYFAGYDEKDMDAQMRADRVWERQTWSLGQGPHAPRGMHPHAEGNAWARWGFSDPFEVLGEAATLNPGETANDGRPRRRLTRDEQRAMDALSLPHQVETRLEVRGRYRELVKDLHPDMNGGQNPDPERLALVLKAWQILRKSRNFTD
ncbi:MAG: J domain-containing protein [Paracoccaceae bacterium]|nr:J domain-containing protein [Paracoccaceae bacterium]